MNNTYTTVSLLYPNADMRRGKGHLSGYDGEMLELDRLIDLRGSSACDYFTFDAEVIRWRQASLKDIYDNPELCRVLLRILPYLNDIKELRLLSEDSDSAGDSYLYSITEAEVYNSLIELLQKELLPLSDKVSSPALTALCARVRELSESDYYKSLSEKLSELSRRVRDIRSITMGVNLDSRLQPESAGVVSVNSEPFRSGDFFERISRLDFKKNEMTCIADLIPFSKNSSENRRLAMTSAFNSAITSIYKSSLREWKNACGAYVLENTDFLLALAPEIEFVTKAAELICRLRDRGCPLCLPEIKAPEDKVFSAKGLCNPVIALKTSGELVPNDFAFDEKGMLYVITGPNRGGKSVITCAVGLAFVMAQLGLPVCAESAALSPCDTVLTHFPSGSDDTVEKGRLGEECARLDAIFDAVSEYSLVLLDESLSSTGSYEGAYIASEVLSGFSIARCRGIFSTHLHDLAADIDRINGFCLPRGGVAVDSLVAEVNGKERSFRIIRRKPDGKSYAGDIADKYGLSFDKISAKLSSKNSPAEH